MNNEITNEIRAQVYRELADMLVTQKVGAGDLRFRAYQLDPPKPVIPDGTLCEGENRAGQTICGYKFGDWLFDRYNEKGNVNAGVDPTVMIRYLTNLRPVRRLGPTQVAVDIPPPVDWPSSAKSIAVAVIHDSTSIIRPMTVHTLTRDEAHRMYEEAWDE